MQRCSSVPVIASEIFLSLTCKNCEMQFPFFGTCSSESTKSTLIWHTSGRAGSTLKTQLPTVSSLSGKDGLMKFMKTSPPRWPQL